MAGGHSSQPLVVKKFEPSQTLKLVAVLLTAIGLIGFAFGWLKNPDHMWPAYLTAFFFVSSLGIGGIFFPVINNMAKAGWSTSIRRISEGMSSFLPVIIAGSMILILGLKTLYPWANPEEVANDALLQAKAPYLNTGFLIVRLLIFSVGMWLFARKIIGNSIKQDQTGDEKLTNENLTWSVAWSVFFAITFSLFSVDLLMSLLPTWYSTIFGIYMFSGMFQSSMAFLLLLLIYMKRKGFVQGYYTADHMHDVAKYMKAFTIFWAYIAFSQFMLIWYANIPEETEFYLMRAQNGWMAISFGLLIFKFIVPFIALLPREWKRNENHVIAVAILILCMQYLDVYWIVQPNFNQNQLQFNFYDIALLAGFMGIFLLTMIRFYSKHSLVAVKDPRINEALNHHVTY